MNYLHVSLFWIDCDEHITRGVVLAIPNDMIVLMRAATEKIEQAFDETMVVDLADSGAIRGWSSEAEMCASLETEKRWFFVYGYRHIGAVPSDCSMTSGRDLKLSTLSNPWDRERWIPAV